MDLANTGLSLNTKDFWVFTPQLDLGTHRGREWCLSHQEGSLRWETDA
jgi:hypothetical protein